MTAEFRERCAVALDEHPGWQPALLRRHREALGLTLDEVADAVRNLAAVDFRPPFATFQSVGRHERGEVFPGPRYRRAYCAVFRRSETELGFRPPRPDAAPPRDTVADAGGLLRRALAYPRRPAENVEVLASLWHADALDDAAVTSADPEPAAWAAATLAWTAEVAGPPPRPEALARVVPGGNVDHREVTALRETAAMFTDLDMRFGGDHARHLLTRFLAQDMATVLRGSYSGPVGVELFSVAAEATMTCGWTAYDAGRHGLAQRYFVQALGLAQAAGDHLLAGEILGRMSHQATFRDQHDDAANLARAANLATAREPVSVLTAEFFTREARAYAARGDADSADAAISAAERAFSRRSDVETPRWATYFDAAELAGELAHCHHDLGRPDRARASATKALNSATGGYPRSDFFVSLILADAHLDAGDPEPACDVALAALDAGTTLKSARCVSYVRDFRARLRRFASSHTVADFTERAPAFRLWNLAT